MSGDFTIAMLQKGRARGLEESKESWKGYAKELEGKLIRAVAKVEVANELNDQIFEEILGIRPKRLSDPENKQLRVRFREERRVPAEEKYKRIGAQNIDI